MTRKNQQTSEVFNFMPNWTQRSVLRDHIVRLGYGTQFARGRRPHLRVWVAETEVKASGETRTLYVGRSYPAAFQAFRNETGHLRALEAQRAATADA